jgi:hypothetical protein
LGMVGASHSPSSSSSQSSAGQAVQRRQYTSQYTSRTSKGAQSKTSSTAVHHSVGHGSLPLGHGMPPMQKHMLDTHSF